MMIDESELFDDVVGGDELQADLVYRELPEQSDLLSDMEVVTHTDRRLVRLMMLHPELGTLRFRKNSLASLDERDKKLLLRDMQEALGMTPLRDG